MALNASGLDLTPATLRDQVYLPARAGSLQPEMLASARRYGRLAVVLPPRLDSLLQTVAGGTPVIVLQNLALPLFPRWHYAVVIGYDRASDEILLHSGQQARLRMSLSTFEYTWGRSGHWAMIAVAPAQPPAHLDPTRWLQGAVALEALDPAAAGHAYSALTVREPESYPAWMGRGNTAFALADFREAVVAFGHATALQPEQADAWNNLARALHASGQMEAGLTAAQRAVTLGGPRLERYRETLRRFALTTP